MISKLLDIDFIHGDMHCRSCKKAILVKTKELNMTLIQQNLIRIQVKGNFFSIHSLIINLSISMTIILCLKEISGFNPQSSHGTVIS